MLALGHGTQHFNALFQQSAYATSRIINCYFGRIVSNFYTHKGMRW